MARNMQGQWTITQSNGFEVVFILFQERDGALHGSARVIGGREANGRGRVSGDSFSFTVDWFGNGRGGRYTGQFDAAGHLSGTTFDLDHPTSQATWFAHSFSP